jgi:4-hydroxy-tetrahydrodipicolinate synthase
MIIQGLYTALITPFDEKTNIDEDGLRALIQYQIQARVDGIVALGTTGEAPTLDNRERDVIIKIAIEEARGKIPIMVGCGTYATKTTIAYAKRAEELGASGLLIVVPYYNKPTQEGVFQHFKALSSEVSIPICIYNIASRTGMNLETSTLERLAELPNIASVKEASGSVTQMADVLERIAFKKAHFSVLSGDDALTLPLIALGGHGIISVISNLLPHAMRRLVDYSRAGKLEDARKIHYQLKALIQAAFVETNPSCIKRMLELSGLPAGRCRLPLVDLTPENNNKIIEALKSPLCEEILTFPKLETTISSTK